MKISLIQTPLSWHDAQANRDYIERKIDALDPADLIVLPEMFTTGFTMHPQQVSEPMSGPTVNWMQAMAKLKNAAITGSVVISEHGNFYNRLLFVRPDGAVETYDKRHLFTLAGENNAYTAGRDKLIVDYRGWKICLLICYDLRFPVFSRNVENYDLLVYVANWPKPRIAAWDALLTARAIENMAYTVGVNRVGQDANGHEYVGHSQIIDALGQHVVAPDENESVLSADLSRDNLEDVRAKFGFLNDRDRFKVLQD